MIGRLLLAAMCAGVAGLFLVPPHRWPLVDGIVAALLVAAAWAIVERAHG